MASKNRNGMGSIRQRPDGRFEARYTGSDGKQHSIYGKTATEVSRALRAATASVDDGDWVQPNRITVAEWMEIWMRDYCAHVRPGTLHSYQTRVEHIKRSIGNIRLAALSQAHVRRVLADAQRQGLAPGTVNNLRIVLATALNRAVDAKLIHESPAAGIHLPKAQPVREMHIIDRPQLPSFLDAARATPYANEIIFLLLTGLRIGELLGLSWAGVDLDKAELTVSRQLVRHSDGYAIADTKTGIARKIRMIPEAVSILRAQRARQKAQRLAAGVSWITGAPHDDLVFRTPQGRHLLFTTISKYTKRAGEAAGISGLHPHDLRHSYAVAALRAGMDVKTVQHNLGHSSAAMTLDVYARYTDDAGAAAARLLSAYLSDTKSF